MMRRAEFTEAAKQFRKQGRTLLLGAGWFYAAWLLGLATSAELRPAWLAAALVIPPAGFLVVMTLCRRNFLRRYRCPGCGRAVPERLRQIVATGRCPRCGETVFEPDAAATAPPEELNLHCGKRFLPPACLGGAIVFILFLGSVWKFGKEDAANALFFAGVALAVLLVPLTIMRRLHPFPLTCPHCGGELSLTLLRHTARCSECGRQLCAFHRNPRVPELPPESLFLAVLRRNRQARIWAAAWVVTLAAAAVTTIFCFRKPFLAYPFALAGLLVLSTASARNGKRLRAIGVPARCPFCGTPLRRTQMRCVFCGERPYRPEK